MANTVDAALLAVQYLARIHASTQASFGDVAKLLRVKPARCFEACQALEADGKVTASYVRVDFRVPPVAGWISLTGRGVMAAQQGLMKLREASLQALHAHFRGQQIPVHDLAERLGQPLELVLEAMTLAQSDGLVDLKARTKIVRGTPVMTDGYVRLLPAGVVHAERPPTLTNEGRYVHVQTSGDNSPVLIGSGTQHVFITEAKTLQVEAALHQIEEACLSDNDIGKQDALQLQKSVEALRNEAKAPKPAIDVLQKHIHRIAEIARDSTLIVSALMQLKGCLGF